MQPTIKDFCGEYEVFSNFSLDPVEHFRTNQHRYQWLKADLRTDEGIEWGDRILLAPTPGQAKKIGNERGRPIRPEWDAAKFYAMRSGLEIKFAIGTGPAQQLLNTGDALLVEGNYWHDVFWGVCNGIRRSCNGHPPYGLNWLGYMLMAQRAILRAAI